MSKQLQSLDQIVESLIKLREEMFASGKNEIGFKINSCLYSQYPHQYPTTKKVDSWKGEVDRQGGSFTQDEINNATAWR